MRVRWSMLLGVVLGIGVAAVADEARAAHTIVPVDIADWVPETGSRRVDPALLANLNVSVCEDHFPVGNPARDEIETGLRLFQIPGIAISINITGVPHQDKAALYADPPAFDLAIDYVQNDDPSTVDGQPCHPDPTDTGCGSWTANTCFYKAGEGWKPASTGYMDASVISINSYCFRHDTNPSSADYFNFNGVSHEMGHVVGLLHASARPLSSNKFQTKMIQAIGAISAYDLAFLEHHYPAPDIVIPVPIGAPIWIPGYLPLLTPELTSTPAIRQGQPDGTTEEGKGSFQDFNSTHLYVKDGEYRDCKTRDLPVFVAQFFDKGKGISDPDVEVAFAVKPDTGGPYLVKHTETVLLSGSTHGYNQIDVTTPALVLTTAELGEAITDTPITATLAFSIDPYEAVGERDETNNVQMLTLTLYRDKDLCPERPVKVDAGVRHVGNNFGEAVAASETTVVVGAPRHDYDETESNLLTWAGAAYVYTIGTDGTATLEAKLVASDRATWDRFGSAVAINGKTIAVGSPYNDFADTAGGDWVDGAGAVYLFEKQNGVWTQTAKLAAPTAESNARMAFDHFGKAVAFSPDGVLLAVGAPDHDYDGAGANFLTGAGAVFLYRKDTVTGLWSLEEKIVASHVHPNARNAYDAFGQSFALANEQLFIAAPDHDYDPYGNNLVANAGAVFVMFPGASGWTTRTKLVASDRAAFDSLGDSLAVYQHEDGAYSVVAGAPFQDTDAAGANFAENAGAVYVFKSDSNGTGYAQNQKLTGAPGTRDRNEWDHFGMSVAIWSNRLVVGASHQDWGRQNLQKVDNAGAAYVFAPDSPTTWTQIEKLTGLGTNGKESDDLFGTSVTISSELVVAGAPYQSWDAAGANELASAGAVFAFFR